MAQAAEKADGFTRSNALYMFESPPESLLGFWIVGSICAALAVGASVYNIRLHIAAARAQGFGEDELISSYGARDTWLHVLAWQFITSCRLGLLLAGRRAV